MGSTIGIIPNKDKTEKEPNEETKEEPKEEPLLLLKQKLEKEAYDKLTNLSKKNELTIENLSQIMSEGANKFKENTGRNMTYAEMREMYG